VLFPFNPSTLAKYREFFTPSHTKVNPTDAELQLELLHRHRDELKPFRLQSATMRALHSWWQADAVWSATRCVSPIA
jgi:hypothetical protein